MNVMQCGQFQLRSASGAYNAMWNLALALRLCGHRVSIISPGKAIPESDRVEARQFGVTLEDILFRSGYERWFFGRSKARSMLDVHTPDIIHLQYVREPFFMAVCKEATVRGIPCVLSLHGGWQLAVFRRGKMMQKFGYWLLFDRRIVKKCRSVHFVSHKERDEYALMQSLRDYEIIPNPVLLASDASDSPRPEFDSHAFRIGYLGRFDIQHKGLDLLGDLTVELGRLCPPVECHLYGKPRSREVRMWESFLQKRPNTPWTIHAPVFGREKILAYKSFDLYVQFSRFELFGISVIEAMLAGIPVAVSERCDYAHAIEESGGGIVLPMQPEQAAKIIATLIPNKTKLQSMGLHAQQWASAEFGLEKIGRQMTDFYERAIQG